MSEQVEEKASSQNESGQVKGSDGSAKTTGVDQGSGTGGGYSNARA